LDRIAARVIAQPLHGWIVGVHMNAVITFANRFMVSLPIAALIAAGCDRPRGNSSAVSGSDTAPHTRSSFDPSAAGEKVVAPHMIKFQDADVSQVLSIYAELSGRSVIRGANLPAAKITFENQAAMTVPEVLQTLDTVLAAQGITMIYVGKQYVKAVTPKEAPQEGPPVLEVPWQQLPDSSSFVMYIVKLKKVQARQAQAALSPFAKLPNSIVAISPNATKGNAPDIPALFGAKDDSVLILRDYSSNVRRMLQVLETLDR
jgi:type II secretory pathway component GspD/PulD (secretin)